MASVTKGSSSPSADASPAGNGSPLDDTPPDAARQVVLEAAFAANQARGKPPYAAVRIQTRGELLWILNRRGWSTQYNRAALFEEREGGRSVEPADLREIILGGTNLGAIELYSADLSGSDMNAAVLTGAQLTDANLSGAHLRFTNLSEAVLRYVDLSDTRLRGAILHRADLTYANLSGARLFYTDLQGANLRGAQMNAATVLVEVQLDTDTRLLDVTWDGASLAQISRAKLPWLGDEKPLAVARSLEEIPLSKGQDSGSLFDGYPLNVRRRFEQMSFVANGRKRRILQYRTAARSYHALVQELRTQGLARFAARYRLREQRLERKALFQEGRIHSWIFSWFMNIVAGYGERPARSLVVYLLAVAGFAVAYYGLGQQFGPHLSPVGAFVLSMTSFHGRGFFPGGIGLDDPITVVAAIEAFVGLIIEITFIATFTQRFLGR